MKVLISAFLLYLAGGAHAQNIAPDRSTPSGPSLFNSVLPGYYSQADGTTLSEIVRRAFESHGEIVVARLEVDKARARLKQAELRPNPSLEFEQSTGALVGTSGDREMSVGLSVPLELYGQRARRIEVAQAEVTLREAELATRRRDLSRQIFDAYAEALSSLREIQVSEELLGLDERTVRFIQIRVNEGETPPLELSLLQTEVDRLRARRQLIEGRVQAAFAKLKLFAGIPPDQDLRLREDASTATLPSLPVTLDAGVATGLQNRPELLVATLEEQLASAGLRLIRAQSRPDLSASVRYSSGRSALDDPRGPFVQKDRAVTFGLSIGIPVFNRNQGARAEAQIAIRQAQERRSFAERVIRNEITTAYRRYEAARLAALSLETAVLPQARANIETMRKVYELGEIKITDLIAEQRRLLDANRELTETITERYRAQAELFLSIGLTLEN